MVFKVDFMFKIGIILVSVGVSTHVVGGGKSAFTLGEGLKEVIESESVIDFEKEFGKVKSSGIFLVPELVSVMDGSQGDADLKIGDDTYCRVRESEVAGAFLAEVYYGYAGKSKFMSENVKVLRVSDIGSCDYFESGSLLGGIDFWKATFRSDVIKYIELEKANGVENGKFASYLEVMK